MHSNPDTVSFQQIFIKEVSKSKLWFFYPIRYNLLIYPTSEPSDAFPKLFTFVEHSVYHPVQCVFSTVGMFSTVGDIMSTVEGCLEYRGECSVPLGDIMTLVEDIMIHVRGYHEYRGGKIFCYLSTSTVLTPHGTHDIPH